MPEHQQVQGLDLEGIEARAVAAQTTKNGLLASWASAGMTVLAVLAAPVGTPGAAVRVTLRESSPEVRQGRDMGTVGEVAA